MAIKQPGIKIGFPKPNSTKCHTRQDRGLEKEMYESSLLLCPVSTEWSQQILGAGLGLAADNITRQTLTHGK